MKLIKRLLPWLLVLVLAVSCAFFGIKAFAPKPADQWEGDGYDSPEAVIEAYVNYWANSDLEGMLSVFAVESYLDTVKSVDAIWYYGAWTQSSFYYDNGYPLKANDEYMKASTALTRIATLNGYIQKHFVYTSWNDSMQSELLTDRDVLLSNSSINVIKRKYTQNPFEPMYNTIAAAEPLQVVYEGIVHIPEAEKEVEENNNRTSFIASRMDLIGATDYQSVVCRVMVNGNAYYFFMDCAKWNGKWYGYIPGGTLYVYAHGQTEYAGLYPAEELEARYEVVR